jgi:hypothetical protein
MILLLSLTFFSFGLALDPIYSELSQRNFGGPFPPLRLRYSNCRDVDGIANAVSRNSADTSRLCAAVMGPVFLSFVFLSGRFPKRILCRRNGALISFRTF